MQIDQRFSDMVAWTKSAHQSSQIISQIISKTGLANQSVAMALASKPTATDRETF